MKALIVGGAGFVGPHLVDHLLASGWSVTVSKLPQEVMQNTGIRIYDLDLLDAAAVKSLLEISRPDCIFHLAAQSSVALSWRDPGLTVDVNIKGTLNLFEALRSLDYKPRILIIGSGEEYGSVNPQEVPIGEDTLLRPGNIYAATKACGSLLGRIYADAYGLDIVVVRAFNHIGPGQSPQFVVGDFCKQVAEIESGLCESVIRVGNLTAKRDFTDVRDVVRAYRLLIEKGRAGQTYNVGSGKSIEIRELLERIISLSTSDIVVEIDPARLRPTDVPVIEADITLLKRDTDWLPDVPLDETLRQTLAYWRSNI